MKSKFYIVTIAIILYSCAPLNTAFLEDDIGKYNLQDDDFSNIQFYMGARGAKLSFVHSEDIISETNKKLDEGEVKVDRVSTYGVKIIKLKHGTPGVFVERDGPYLTVDFGEGILLTFRAQSKPTYFQNEDVFMYRPESIVIDGLEYRPYCKEDLGAGKYYLEESKPYFYLRWNANYKDKLIREEESKRVRGKRIKN